MKSRVYKRNGKMFRYDYDHALVILVEKATQEDIDTNKEWKEKYDRALFDIDEDGYTNIDSVGLSKSNWDNKESRNEYLDGWCEELNAEIRALTNEFLRWG